MPTSSVEEAALVKKVVGGLEPWVFDRHTPLKIRSVRVVGGGWTHLNYVFALGNRRYLFRMSTLKGNRFAPGATRAREHIEREYSRLRCLEGAGIAPRAYYKDVSCGKAPMPFMIIDYVEGSRVGRLGSGDLSDLAEQLAELHSAPVPPCIPINNFNEEFDEWVARRVKRIATDPSCVRFTNDSFKAELEEAYAKARGVELGPTLRVMLHGDPAGENLVRTKAGLKLIDWEGVTAGPPQYDISTVIDREDLEGERLSVFLGAYRRRVKLRGALLGLRKYEQRRYVAKLALALNEILKIKLKETDAMQQFPLAYHVKAAHKLLKKCKGVGIFPKSARLAIMV